MAAHPSFDITSTVNLQEVDNAVNQARKEVAQRYDFKGSNTAIDFKRAENLIAITTEDTFRMDAVWDILQTRIIRQSVPVKNMKLSDVEPISGGSVKRTITLQQGIDTDAAKAIVKSLKEQNLNEVQATIQADQVRVASPSKDELQQAIRVIRGHDFGVELQFGNFRD